jgi:hypothetical protein
MVTSCCRCCAQPYIGVTNFFVLVTMLPWLTLVTTRYALFLKGGVIRWRGLSIWLDLGQNKGWQELFWWNFRGAISICSQNAYTSVVVCSVSLDGQLARNSQVGKSASSRINNSRVGRSACASRINNRLSDRNSRQTLESLDDNIDCKLRTIIIAKVIRSTWWESPDRRSLISIGFYGPVWYGLKLLVIDRKCEIYRHYFTSWPDSPAQANIITTTY